MSEETDLEKDCVKLANAAGFMNRKLDVGPGAKGWLDQVFFGYERVTFFVEFKTPDGVASLKQRRTMRELAIRGHNVRVVDNEEYFIKILQYMKSQYD